MKDGPLDPYAELGVPQDADEATIKAAARVAYKATHPDAGGDVDSFQRKRRSELVLLDPVLREKFDRTGSVDDEKPDNTRAGALQIVETFIGPLLEAYINSGFDPAKDPRKIDIVAKLKDKLKDEIEKWTGAVPNMESMIEFFSEMKGRFDTTEPEAPIQRSLDRQIARVRGQIRDAKDAIEMRRLALEIAGNYTFRFDAPEPAPQAFEGLTIPGWLRPAGPG